MNSKQRVGSRWCWAAGKSCAGGCVRRCSRRNTESGSALPVQHWHTTVCRGCKERCTGIKVGDISLTAGSGQQSEATVLEMVGDLLDSAGVCVQGVDVCSRNR